MSTVIEEYKSEIRREEDESVGILSKRLTRLAATLEQRLHAYTEHLSRCPNHKLESYDEIYTPHKLLGVFNWTTTKLVDHQPGALNSDASEPVLTEEEGRDYFGNGKQLGILKLYLGLFNDLDILRRQPAYQDFLRASERTGVCIRIREKAHQGLHPPFPGNEKEYELVIDMNRKFSESVDRPLPPPPPPK